MQQVPMDIEVSTSSKNNKGNDTILQHINQQLKESNSRNFIYQSETRNGQDSMDNFANEMISNCSNPPTQQDPQTIKRKYISVQYNVKKGKMTSHEESMISIQSQAVQQRDEKPQLISGAGRIKRMNTQQNSKRATVIEKQKPLSGRDSSKNLTAP